MSAISLGSDLIHYEVLGRGRPVILLHSWVGSWRYWVPTMQQLQLKYKVYALDLYGYGDSVKNAQKYSLEHQVQLLTEFVDKLGIAKTALVGHGLGAMVAVEYARRFQDRVPRMLVVSAPLFDPGDLDKRRTVMPQVASMRQQPVPGDAHPEATIMSASSAMRAALMAAAGSRPGADPARMAGSEKPSSHNGPNPLQDCVAAPLDDLLRKCFKPGEEAYDKLKIDISKADHRAVSQSTTTFDAGDMLEKLRLLSMPVVLVHGTDDDLIPPPKDSVWNYLTVDKEDTVLPVPLSGVRHFPMLEYDRFFRLVTDFLDSPDVSKLEIKERWKRRTR
jgi:pimeloyl-ACP methyl ester carboxylesterase